MESAQKAHKQAQADLRKHPRDMALRDKEFLARKEKEKAELAFDDYFLNGASLGGQITSAATKALSRMRDVRNMKPSDREKHYAILRDRTIPKAERWAEATLAEKVNWQISTGDPAIASARKVATAAIILLGGVTYLATRRLT